LLYEYEATRCSDLATVTVIYPTTLSVGTTYYIFGTPKYACYTIDSYVGTTADAPTHVFTGTISGCDNINCEQA
jgi:hypothetical protein